MSTKHRGSRIPIRLDGKVVAITGATSGIGKATAEDLANRGARLLLLCRDLSKAQTLASEITAMTKSWVDAVHCDLSSLASVRKCAEEILAKETQIDILVNNAGVCVCPHWKTEDGFEMQIGTNHFGHFLLTQLLLPLLEKSAANGMKPRIVIVSSLAHEHGKIRWDDLHWDKKGAYDNYGAYNQSKLANVLHAKELARRVQEKGIFVCSLHPGRVKTEGTRHVYDKWYGSLAKVVWNKIAMSTVEGAQTTIYCCLEPSILDRSGAYFGNCKEHTASKRARNEEDQLKLWELSEELVGLRGTRTQSQDDSE